MLVNGVTVEYPRGDGTIAGYHQFHAVNVALDETLRARAFADRAPGGARSI
ncbi:MAG: hypothetical protein IT198_03340 [Acidimicrobiia bacterium]|nr:hypothetical protein [Acidimicrobiia bacterium]